ncbi:GDP-fucose transporter 1 [Strongyloides ratti]|uniref:GDP-fucose transporter 1 n=1 Tax=Strongyloides ratti TaxID=34506 RepID=A0A090KYQ7_STRRB|nr:GDP-fucose transporter 1 [Strongyloides ratti]CEF60354.1 GDP-fucose transporter 1 [Strongyloides ratti]
MSHIKSGKDNNFFIAALNITLAVSAYWITSIGLVFVNKYLLSSPELKLDAPLFITWYQCICTVGFCYFFALLRSLFPNIIKFPLMDFKISVSRKIAPLSIIFVAMITFNNLCLQYVGVSFYYVGRSLTTVFNVVCSYLILGQKTSYKALLCCGLIIFGFLLGVNQEGVSGSLSIFGVICGVLASLFVALQSIFVQKSLPEVNQSIWLLTLHNNINACILFLPLLLVSGELGRIPYFEYLWTFKFWSMMTLSGFLGFIMGYVTGWQIQVTSPLTHNISGTAKAAAQTVIGVIWYSEIKTILWWASNIIVLVGSCLYTKVKSTELRSRIENETSADKEKRSNVEESSSNSRDKRLKMEESTIISEEKSKI